MADEIQPAVPLATQFPEGYRAMQKLAASVRAAVDPALLELVQLRASQINGCAYCLDMHTKDALAAGETSERLALLPAWRETRLYTEQERAALALTEAITRIADQHVPADVEQRARAAFDEATYAAIVFAIVLINGWNRLAITGHSEPGHYQPGQHR
ncbi:MAG TPA: carboxymuconolactone decarboxylase family protein [Ilumatobacter sp.]|nr:carboxymuconolactone decarboxylase family protein [Ilumatobacter sp.]